MPELLLNRFGTKLAYFATISKKSKKAKKQKVYQNIYCLVGLVLAKRSPNGDIHSNIRKLIRADDVEKCRAKFIDPLKIKTVENEGRIKIRDPWQMHKCCKSDSCGSPTK